MGDEGPGARDERTEGEPEPATRQARGGLPRHWVLLIAGALLDLIGSVLAFQGLTVLTGSETPALNVWAGAGAVCIVFGMVLIILAMRHKAEHG